MKAPAAFARHQAVGAYRRWSPPDFGAQPAPEPAPARATHASPLPGEHTEPSVSSAPSASLAPPTPVGATHASPTQAPTLPPGISLPTVAEIENIHEEARRSGFDEGLAEGRKQGHAEGREAGFAEGHEAGFAEGKADAETEARHLHELAGQLEQALARLDGEVAKELLSLSIEVARKVIQHTLAVEPDAILSVVRSVLQTLPQVRTEISLNPEDLALVRKHIGEIVDQGGHVLVEDANITRGGCRVETPGAQIDATIETRWRRALESLGQENAPWVESTAAASKAKPKTRRKEQIV
jgi:flagellar assembly protein FliH